MRTILTIAIIVVTLAILAELFGRSLRCEWCHRPYAYWKRGGARCCYKHWKEGRRHTRIAKERLSPYRPPSGRSIRKRATA